MKENWVEIRDGEVYSNAGPTCPYCKTEITPDESFFYDENRYTEDECPECEKKFKVEVYIETSWTTRMIK